MIGEDIEFNKIISINNILVFVIKPIYYRTFLEPSDIRRYIRILETKMNKKSKWNTYLPALKGLKDKFLICYWNTNILKKKHFDMLVAFEAEKDDMSLKLRMSAYISIISFALLYFTNHFPYFGLLGIFSYIIKGFVSILSFLGFSSAGVVLGVIIVSIIGNYISYKFFNEKK